MDAKLSNAQIAIYARYSSDRQRETSIDDQVRRCRQYVADNGGTVSDSLVFCDEAVSAASLEREGWLRLKAAVQHGAVDTVVVESTSRISRDLGDSSRLYSEFRYLGVRLIGVADGIDTNQPGAKLAYSVKGLLDEQQLERLRDETYRGLEGRAEAGYATGAQPYGYSTEPEHGANGEVIGHRIVIVPDQAAVVRQIFRRYAEGASYGAIARELNEQGVAKPRRRGRSRGWIASAIREMLRNERYRGVWTYGERSWVKVPETNKRRPRPANRPAVRREYPERRIVDEELWQAVQQRLAATAQKYKQKHTAPRQSYLLSGVLRCGQCGAPMTIYSGRPHRRYRCSDNHKRGTCTNRLTVREATARENILGAVSDQLANTEIIEYVRRRVAQRQKELEQRADDDLHALQKRLDRTEAELRRLVDHIADGTASESVSAGIQQREATARRLRQQIEQRRRQTSQPTKLPSPQEVVQRVLQLEGLLARDVDAGRQALKGLLRDGGIRMEPGQDGVYTAVLELLPGRVLMRERPEHQVPGPSDSAGCGDRI